MRLTGGEGKGRKLILPPPNVRPTSGRVREVLFQVIRDYIYNSSVLDLYAGAGLLGLEARARGCADVTFVDINRASVQTIRKNIALCGWEGTVKVYKSDAFSWLRSKGKVNKPFNLIFADPPYADKELPKLLEVIKESEALAPDGLFIYEASSRDQLQINKTWTQIDLRKMGDTQILICKLAAE